MSNEAAQYNVLATFLINGRNACLDDYLISLRTKGAPFDSEDRLVSRVRASTIFDALIDGFQKKKIDQLSDYFQEVARQLLGAGYNFDQIKIVYDTLEASINKYFDETKASVSLTSGLQSIKNTLVLARTIAINQYMLQVNTAAISQNKAKVNNPPFNSAPPPVNNSTQFQPKTNPDSPANGATTTTSDKVRGFLMWPLKQIVGTKPPEYLAYFENGTQLQVLLVDRPEAYQGAINDTPNRVACYIRRVGPLALAYPL